MAPRGGITVTPVLPNNEFTFSPGLSLPAGTEVVCDLTVALIGQTVQAEAPRVFLESLGGTPSTPGATGSGGLPFGPLAGGVAILGLAGMGNRRRIRFLVIGLALSGPILEGCNSDHRRGSETIQSVNGIAASSSHGPLVYNGVPVQIGTVIRR